MRQWVAIVVVAVGLAGCGDSGLNPFGWIGGQSENDVETLSNVSIVEVQDPRPLVPSVTSARLDRTPGGAILRATGLAPRQGWHTASLVPRNDGVPTGGVLTFDFRAVPPDRDTPVSTVQSREIIVGYPLSDITLANVRAIRVVSASNIATARR